TTDDWPAEDRSFGQIIRLAANSPLAFAAELEKARQNVRNEVLVSLERLLRCDIYRAGDGVHQAWLNRREKYEMPWRKFVRGFNRKHRDLLRLEESLFDQRGAERVIVNSRMVKNEIMDIYNYR